MSEQVFDPARHLTKVSGRRPMTPEHREKIRQALRRYNANGGHLSEYHKSGPEHPNWRGGVKPDYYQRIAYEAYGHRCDTCSAEPPTYLLVHHRDENRSNNDVRNLQVLCMSCHLKHHRGKAA